VGLVSEQLEDGTGKAGRLCSAAAAAGRGSVGAASRGGVEEGGCATSKERHGGSCFQVSCLGVVESVMSSFGEHFILLLTMI
jgi:hypothetical protein